MMRSGAMHVYTYIYSGALDMFRAGGGSAIISANPRI